MEYFYSMKKIIILILPILLPGCAVLTDSQVKNINAFAVTAKAYSDYPGAIPEKLTELHVDNELLTASQFRDSGTINQRLRAAQQFQKAAGGISAKFDLSLQLIQQYSGLLTNISGNDFTEDLHKNAKELGENLSGLITSFNAKMSTKIPGSVSTVISEAILSAGRLLTKRKQTLLLKKFLEAGDTLIQVTLKNLTEVLDSDEFRDAGGRPHPSLKAMIEQEKEDFISNYNIIVFSKPGLINYSSVSLYYRTLTDYESLELLRQKIVASAGTFANAHALLIQNSREKKKLGEIIQETQAFIQDTQDLFKTVKELFKGTHPTT
jgi:hypothetical protein